MNRAPWMVHQFISRPLILNCKKMVTEQESNPWFQNLNYLNSFTLRWSAKVSSLKTCISYTFQNLCIKYISTDHKITVIVYSYDDIWSAMSQMQTGRQQHIQMLISVNLESTVHSNRSPVCEREREVLTDIGTWLARKRCVYVITVTSTEVVMIMSTPFPASVAPTSCGS
jgi:hypothetical protein